MAHTITATIRKDHDRWVADLVVDGVDWISWSVFKTKKRLIAHIEETSKSVGPITIVK